MILTVIFCLLTLGMLAFCAASEIAFFSLSSFERSKILHDRRHSKQLRFCLNHLSEILTIILLLTLMASISFSLLVEHLFHAAFGSHPVLLPVGAALSTLIVVLFGEVIPKNIAFFKRMVLARHVAHFWYGLVLVTLPVVKRFSDFVGKLSQAFLGFFVQKQDFNKIKEMKHLLALARRKGSFSEFEQALIQNIAELHTVNAKDLMTPRVDVKMLSLKWSRAEAVAFIQKNKHTFFPVHKGLVDQLAGLLDARAFLLLEGEVKDQVQPALYVPETIKFVPLLSLMKENHVEVVIVVDEYGGFAGLIRYLDILERLTGNEDKEFKEIQNAASYLGKGRYRVRGEMSLEDIRKLLHVEIPEYQSDTLNGLIQEVTGNIPKEGATINIAPLHIKVVKASRKSLLKAEIWRDKR